VFKPDFKYSSLSFVRISGTELRINLQLAGKILLKLDSTSSLLWEYGRIAVVMILYFLIIICKVVLTNLFMPVRRVE